MIETTIIENRIEIKSEPSTRLNMYMRAVPDKGRYLIRAGIWKLPLTIDNLKFISETPDLVDIFTPDLQKKYQELKSPLAVKKIDFNFKTEAFDHQRKGFLLGVNNNELFLMWEMGTGKTKVAIDVIKYRSLSKVLIIAPKTVLTSWENEFKIHSNLIPALYTGSQKKRERILAEEPIILMSYGMFGTFGVFNQKTKRMLGNGLTLHNFEGLVLDESHYIKSGSARRSRVAHNLAKTIPFKLLLSGTPVPNGAEDIFSQFQALDNGATFGSSFFAFRNKYFVNKGWGTIPDWQIKEGSLEEIRSKMFLKADRVTKKQCLDLPPKVYQRIDVEMTPEQRKAYYEMEEEFYTEIITAGGIEAIETRHLVTKIMKLSQITSGFIYKYKDKPGYENKTERVAIPIKHNKLNILKELVADKDKAVIWCLFQEDLKNVMESLAEFNPVRTDSWKEFQTDPDIKIMVGQVHSGGVGITLTASEYVVYYSQNYSASDRQQNEDRTHRVGTKGTVVYIDLVCPGTVDEDILRALSKKRATAEYMTGDITREVFEQIKLRYENRK